MTNGSRVEVPSLVAGVSALASVLPSRGHDQRATSEAREAHLWTVLDIFPRAVFLIAPDGTVAGMNTAAVTVLRSCSCLRVGSDRRLRVLDSRADTMMQQAIASARQAEEAAVHCIECRHNDANTLDVAVMSVGDAAVAVVVSDRAALTATCPVTLRKLYGLTPTEQRVVSALMVGASVREAAAQMGITLNTIRRHLKQIFAKTGVGRQSDLVRLVTCGPAILRFDAVRDARSPGEKCHRREH